MQIHYREEGKKILKKRNKINKFVKKIKPIKEEIDIPEDVITSRILWLDGLEDGVNKGGDVDSKERFIYIHGTAEEGLIGKPASIGLSLIHISEPTRPY